ncbi:MAG TPA: hypothetical protein VI564_07755 [Candidatus Nanoarchaeia archaeon]|nr:hypothetical protein [Candidatus Nanoarchaeia archaeon]
MKTWVHTLASLILAAILYKWAGLLSGIVLISGVLIDGDHFLWHLYNTKNFSLKKCYDYFIKTSEKGRVHENDGILLIFHTIEALIALAVLSFYSKIILVFTIGILLHYALDLIWLYSIPGSFIADHSLIHWIIKTNSKALNNLNLKKP